MSLSVKVRARDAERTKKELDRNGCLDKSRKIHEEEGYIFIPISGKKGCDISSEHSFSRKKLIQKNKNEGFKERIIRFLSSEEKERVKTSYDIVGDLAILEIDEDLRKREKKIAEALLESNKVVNGVFRKSSAHEGKYRTQKLKYLAGEQRLETMHKENGIRLKLDIEKVYFSVRQSTERKRIAEKVRDQEKVLVLFSGCGPFPCVIAKRSSPKFICGVEINPIGHRYAIENVELNRLDNIYLLNEDAKNVDKIRESFAHIAEHDGYFDRIIMPHPSDCESFLPYALEFAKDGTVIDLYTFSDEDKIKEKEVSMHESCIELGWKSSINESVLCGQHSPGKFRICIEFKVKKNK